MHNAGSVQVGEREVGRIERAYLFGHYDSRGGSTLVVAKNLSRALVSYAASFGYGDEVLEHDAAEEDYVARYVVIVCDRPLSSADDGAELLADYRDDGGGYRLGVLQSRWRDASRRRWSKWKDTSCAILWADKVPTVTGRAGPFRDELRIDRRDVGEDAWGLGLLWPADER
jgi:hypothetical protein